MSFSTLHFLASILLVPGFVVAQVKLPHVGPAAITINSRSLLLTDTHRRDPLINDGRLRSVMVSSFSPAKNCDSIVVEQYMPPYTSHFMDKKFGAYGLPNGTFPSLQTESCTKPSESPSCGPADLPLVLFSGALGTSRFLYTVMLRSVAAHGCHVVSIDHPYDADIVEYPNGTIITGIDIKDDQINQTVATRADDIAFVYRSLDKVHIARQLFPALLPRQHRTAKAAVLGHSLGGAAAAAAMLQLPSLRGGINLDGTMFGPVLDKGLDRPFLLIGHDNKTQATDPSWKTTWPKLRSWKKEVEVRKTAHYSFSDLPFLLKALGAGEASLPGIEGLLGSIEGVRMMRLTVAHVVAMLDMVLKTGSEAGFEAAAKEFPEAKVVA